MRRTALLLVSVFMLSGCVSYIESVYDNEARANCDTEVRRHGAYSCYDQVDRERRERRRARGD